MIANELQGAAVTLELVLEALDLVGRFAADVEIRAGAILAP
jgi:hypothetical protein